MRAIPALVLARPGAAARGSAEVPERTCVSHGTAETSPGPHERSTPVFFLGMDAFTAVVGLAGLAAAAFAAYFSWQAVRAARHAIALQREQGTETRRERLLKLLSELEWATFGRGEAASLAAAGRDVDKGPAARARYQVAYRAAAVEFELPKCQELSKEANVETVISLHQMALSEISEKRNAVMGENPSRI